MHLTDLDKSKPVERRALVLTWLDILGLGLFIVVLVGSGLLELSGELAPGAAEKVGFGICIASVIGIVIKGFLRARTVGKLHQHFAQAEETIAESKDAIASARRNSG